VKTGGYRVELGEIEAALYSHPAVREAAAVPVPDELLGNKIKAFVVAEENSAMTEVELKHYCGLSLPSYMVPEEIEFRASLPRTSTDKIDRSYLQAENRKSQRLKSGEKAMEETQMRFMTESNPVIENAKITADEDLPKTEYRFFHPRSWPRHYPDTMKTAYALLSGGLQIEARRS